MLISGRQFGFEFMGGSSVKDAEQSALKRTMLFQYTNLDSFFKIITGNYLKFNRVDNVNDRKEKKYFEDEEVYKLEFISCFSYTDEESIPLWHIYTYGGYGLRFGLQIRDDAMKNIIKDSERPVKAVTSRNTVETLNFQNDSLHNVSNKKWYVELNQRDIIYDEAEIHKNPIHNKINGIGDFYNLTATCAIKDNSWAYEQESRIIAILKTTGEYEIPDYEYLLVPISFKNIIKLMITYSPWMSDEIKESVQLMVHKHLSECNVEFVNSRFQDCVLRK